jgi:hypothetical protein
MEFTRAMPALRNSRLRCGAASWELFQDPSQPGRFLEIFRSDSWDDHLRLLERRTTLDQALEEFLATFHAGESPPRVCHYFGVKGFP